MNKMRVQNRFPVCCLVLLWLIAIPVSAQTASGSGVGEVSLVLGTAYRHSLSGSRTEIERGSEIAVYDRITTASNGHVHIRFIDDALVSVRPNSELEIVRYEFDPQRPELSAVKFNLREGVTRAISGEVARSARDRFRLNTPIAAIGVRGTDFVVSANEDTTRALVNEGIIVMAPFSDACSVDALAPCLTNALELGGNSPQMVTMDENTPLPRLLPAGSIRNPDMMQEEVQRAIASVQQPASPLNPVDADPEQATPDEVLLEGVTNQTVTVDAEEAAIAALTPPDFTPSSAVSLGDVTERQLVWGRYTTAGLEAGPLTLAFADAAAGRQITVGNFQYGLFRTEEGPRRAAANSGLVGFQLNSAQAVYNSATGVVAMQVNGGSLNIDFQQNAFSTQLNLSHDLTGRIDLSASGQIFDGGLLRAIEETQRVAGAVSLDGSEAGYLFERALDNGSVSGLTLWDSVR